MSSGLGALDAPLALSGFVSLFTVLGFLILWYEAPEHAWWRSRVRDWATRLTGRSDLAWVDLPLLTAIAAAAFAVCASATWVLGGYGCTPGGGPSDLTTLVTSGRAFLAGGNPFTITACNHGGNPVPAGMASVLLDALGAVAGPAGVLLVWGAVSVAVLPLIWYVAGPSRAPTTVFVLASFLYLPIVAVQIDGASLALVPFAVLLVLYAARRGWVRAAAVGGFLATGRFPALFPILGASGRAGARRGVAFLSAFGAFAVVTAATFAVYGERFAGPVFWLQFGRSHFALDYWGVLQGEGWLSPSSTLTVVQAGLTLAVVGICWVWARSELGAAAIVLTTGVLLAQYLSFTELVFLVPVALLGTRARWWLWGIGAVAATNYLVVLGSRASVAANSLTSYGFDLVLTALLVGLLVDLVRSERGVPAPGKTDRAAPASRTD